MSLDLLDKKILIKAGSSLVELSPEIPFNSNNIDFISELSKSIIKSKTFNNSVDLISFAFWARKNNLLNLKKKNLNLQNFKIGRGIIFHLPPSNVPINFIYSFCIGLISGNSNIVKLPKKNFIVVNSLISIINHLFKKKKYKNVKSKNSFIKYDSSDNDITEKISYKSNVRMIWGGDKKVQDIINIKPNKFSIDIPFHDKYSLSIINLDKLTSLDNKNYNKQVYNFFKDAFFMDQNACGSPHLIIFLRKKKKNNEKKKFWKNLSILVKEKYDQENISILDKFNQFNEDCLNKNNIKKINLTNNPIYIAELKRINNEIINYRGKWGYFYEFETNNLSILKNFVNYKFQTVSYFGLEKNEILNFLSKNNLTGIDRFVPIGKSHTMDVIWDGFDLLSMLTRSIKIE